MAKLTICLLVCFCSVYVVSGVLVTVPENTVGKVDTTITLYCEAATTPIYRVMWTEFVTNTQGRVISDNRSILPSHPNAARYQITGGPDEYNLEIMNATLADGGRYLCGDSLANPPDMHQGFAELVILAGDPECTEIYTETGVIVEDFFYTKECEVRYQGFFPPNMTWTGPGTYNTDNSVTSNVAWTRISFTARREIEGGQFVCTTRFVPSESPLPPDSATNIPDYEYVYSGTILIVNWGPQEITIIPRKDFYEVGDVLTCEADGKPEPRFTWTNMRTLVTEPPGPTFTIKEELLGTEQLMRCNANSLIEGSIYVADSFANVSVPALTTPTTTPIPTEPTSPLPDAPCNDLTGQWTATNPNALVCIEVDQRGNILALIRNGTDPYFVTGSGKTVRNDYKHVGFTGHWPAGARFAVAGFSGECHRFSATRFYSSRVSPVTKRTVLGVDRAPGPSSPISTPSLGSDPRVGT